MATGSGGGMIAGMDPRPTSRHLDPDLVEDPVSGRTAQDGGEPRRFVGYAGLIASLQAIRSGEGTGAPEAAGDSGTPDV
jgi:hypothetical protein